MFNLSAMLFWIACSQLEINVKNKASMRNRLKTKHVTFIALFIF